MIWKFKPRKSLICWHSWFAWHPVTTKDSETVWLEKVWRRCTFSNAQITTFEYCAKRFTASQEIAQNKEKPRDE